MQPNETRTVAFKLAGSELARWDTTSHAWKVDDGRVNVMVGASSADVRPSHTIAVRADE